MAISQEYPVRTIMLNFGRSKKTGFQSLSQYLTMGELKLGFYRGRLSHIFLSCPSLQSVDSGPFKAGSSVHMN